MWFEDRVYCLITSYSKHLDLSLIIFNILGTIWYKYNHNEFKSKNCQLINFRNLIWRLVYELRMD